MTFPRWRVCPPTDLYLMPYITGVNKVETVNLVTMYQEYTPQTTWEATIMRKGACSDAVFHSSLFFSCSHPLFFSVLFCSLFFFLFLFFFVFLFFFFCFVLFCCLRVCKATPNHILSYMRFMLYMSHSSPGKWGLPSCANLYMDIVTSVGIVIYFNWHPMSNRY